MRRVFGFILGFVLVAGFGYAQVRNRNAGAGPTGPRGAQGATPHAKVSTDKVNTLTAPEDFSNAAWSEYHVGAGNSAPTVVVSDGGVFYQDPDGTYNAQAVTFNSVGSGANLSFLYQTACPNPVASSGAVGSVWLKSPDGGSGAVEIVVGIDPNTTCVVCTYDSVWGRCEASNTGAGVGSATINIGNIPSACGSAGVVQTVLVWHAQCQTGVISTDPIR